ncbi:circularly permuted type 2 ATP-grasp protein [Desulforamulus ruminis]|uniref:Uncharacterized protein n=1 Tax=Desulforamulus ruminis (strain ATCC 23193 / DSM 2154 / NCIMB 8452 / DL) TaxID=696281 RepID=F6DR32_DESRL|nr:circularly permuted type 2 ATP-grasp protein [Desulforamulus ruminis]AEG59751.1 hypothetical protein Desru_1485 [Desulforamulus ruminis DSM 2154]
MLAMNLFNQYRAQVLADPGRYITSYKQVFDEVQRSAAQYKGKPVAFLYQPLFLSEANIQQFDQLTQKLYGILEKVIQHYLADKGFRAYFGFSPLLEKLILKDPGYKIDIPIARFDIFYDFESGSFQFCELNTDGSSAMVEQQELAKIFSNALTIQEFKKDYKIYDFELFDSLVEVIKSKYKEFSKGSSQKPQVAIVDWLEGKAPSEFVEFQKAFERAGCQAVIADPRGLAYRDGKLYYQDFRIDCIYRRAVTWEIIEKADSVKGFIDAYLNGDVCVVGPLRSQIAHNKIIFALLHDAAKTPFLTQEERNFVKNHIPFTTIFDSNNPDLVEDAIANKDQRILKPMDRYASKGVRAGRDHSAEEWLKIIQEEAKEEYLLQEFCRVPKVPMAFFKDGEAKFRECGFTIGLFMYGGSMQGVYTRAGVETIIGSLTESYSVPSFVFVEK